MDKIIVKGARENNLKNIDIELPKNKLIVMTGVSGSGKSSLAFDTIYAEGERRYVESLSAYARQFLGGTDKPDVDSIEGLSPSISIDQKTTNKNPRSTVGTVTEIYDYLRLLYARIGVPYCPNHGKPITSQSIEEMTNQILKLDENTKIRVLSPIVYGEKGTHKDLLDRLRTSGYVRVIIDNEEFDLNTEINLDKNKKHNILIVIDRLIIKDGIRSRLYEAIELASKEAKGRVVIDVIGGSEIVMSEKYACPDCDFSLPELEPRMFSFNAPYGACDCCSGLGFMLRITDEAVVTDENKSLLNGAMSQVFGSLDAMGWYRHMLDRLAIDHNTDLTLPYKALPPKFKDELLHGTGNRKIKYTYTSRSGHVSHMNHTFEGVIPTLERRAKEIYGR